MSDEEEAYVNLRLKLADGLKARCQAHGITQLDLAQAIKSGQSPVAKREAGDPRDTRFRPASFGRLQLRALVH